MMYSSAATNNVHCQTLIRGSQVSGPLTCEPRYFCLYLQRILILSCARQIESKLSLRSFAKYLQSQYKHLGYGKGICLRNVGRGQ